MVPFGPNIVGHIGMQISPHISKTHLPIVSLNVCELELNCCSEQQSRKKGDPLVGGWNPNSPSKALIFIKRRSLFA